MTEDTELLTGRAGEEARQGYSPMPEAHPEPAEPAMTERELAHFNRPPEADWGPEIERVYQDADGSGKRRDENETVEADRAADDLKAIRDAERAAREEQSNRDLAEALDQLRREALGDLTGQPQQAQQPEQQQPEAQQYPEIEQPQPDQYQQEQAAIADAEKRIEEVLKDPWVRTRIETEFDSVKQQAAAEVQQAKTAYQHGLAQNAATALAVLTVDFPEFAGLSGPQLDGALRVSNPQRVEAFRQRVNQVNAVIGTYQQHVGQQQQHFREQQIEQQQQAAYQLEQFKVSEVKRFEQATSHIPPETMRNITDNVMPTVEKYYGLKEADMRDLISGRRKVDSQAFMHSTPFQLMLMDAVRYRMSQAAIPRAVARPVPQVQRPGVSEPSRGDDGEVAALWSKLNQNNRGLPGIRAAADLVAARRRARG